MTRFKPFDRVSDAIITEIAGTMFALGDLVAVEAQISITAGSVSGKGHVPSVAPDPPNNDTGRLAGGIEVQQVAPLRVRVVSTIPYSIPLETGTSKMEARPFLGPARDSKRKDIQQHAARAVNRALRKFARGRR